MCDKATGIWIHFRIRVNACIQSLEIHLPQFAQDPLINRVKLFKKTEPLPPVSDIKRPLVTLAVFAYNQSKFIGEAVESALSQTYSPLQIILSDDNSQDSTFDVMRRMALSYRGPHEILVRRNLANQGLARHINTVLAEASGEFICWAAGDDVSLSGKIEALVAPMIKDKSVMGTHSFVNEIDESGSFIRIRKPAVPRLICSAIRVIAESIEVVAQSHAFRREIHERFGPLDSTVTNEGIVMAFREACLGGILLVERPLTGYRVGVGTSTRRGQSTEELAVTEPTKCAGWWSSGYNQILRDADRVAIAPALQILIKQRVKFYDAVFAVNARPFNFSALSSSLFRPGFLVVLKAFVRRNAPRFLLAIYYRRRGWLPSNRV